ncbi:MAG: PH domain-containing protein, partial [Bryobacterales bacterium]|nr:PH domain-containing protein [Bryobacterales bacterium]
PTKVDTWLKFVSAAYIVLSIGLPSWHLGSMLSIGEPFDPGLVVLPLGVLAFMWMLAYPCEYLFEAKYLIVRSGLLRIRIPLLAITSVKPSRNPLSAPAWSLDRLDIRYGRTKRVLISPREKDAFLADLELRAPHLIRQGDTFVVREEWKTAEER